MVNLKKADIPILLMVLLQLTGDKKWIQHPYLPARDLAFFPDESGGLSATLQNDIRIAACDSLLDYFDGKLIIAEKPSRELYVEMMSVCVGEAIPSEYLEMMLEEMGFQEREAEWIKRPTEQNLNNFKKQLNLIARTESWPYMLYSTEQDLNQFLIKIINKILINKYKIV